MIIYNPKDWWRLIFAFHKSDTFRKMLPGILGVAVFTAVVAYIENDLIHASFKNTTAIHSLVGFVLSLLLVFRTNSAYERWWEGRKLWGSFVNNSRNLALKIHSLTEDAEVRKTFAVLIENYVTATKDTLRDRLDLAQMRECNKYSQTFYNTTTHLPNQVMKALYAETMTLHRSGKITGEQLLFINAELQSFTDNMGACERIKKTPIPYSYNIFIKKVIFLYVFTMPFGFVREFGYWAAPIVSLLFYVFGSIELIAEEIEDPFGDDANDLPLDAICGTISKSVREILE